MAEKRYYWLKLKDDFFAQKEIKKLRKVAGGDTYTIIYLKMQLRSVKNGGTLLFEGIEDSFYEELALDLEEEPENVKMTLLFLEKYKLIEELSSEEFLLPSVCDSIGSEGSSAERVRRLRENKKTLQCNEGVTQVKRVGNVEIEKEKREDIDPEKEAEAEKEAKKTKKSTCFRFYEENIGMITSIITESINSYLDDGIEENLICKAIEIATEQNKRSWSYCKAILERCIKENIYTLTDFTSKQLEHSKAKVQATQSTETTNIFKKLLEEGAFDE